MTYTLIGTGNMAWFLAQRLNLAGFDCKGIYGRNYRNAKDLAATLNADAIEDFGMIEDGNDCCILAVSDHAIAELANRFDFQYTVLVHTAGSVSLDAISCPHKAVLWPIYSIVKSNLPLNRDIPIVYEAGSMHAKEMVLSFAHAISDTVQEVSGLQRQWLHLTAVFGNNFTNHLMAICERICREQGLPFSILLPILQQTFERIKTTAPSEAQTGPAKRGDTATIEAQLSLLAANPEWQQVYRALSESIRSMYPG